MATDEQMMQALRARGSGKKPLFIAGGVVLLLVIVGVVFAFRGGSDASRHFSALSRCLIGPPVAPGENVFFRLREAQLGAKQAPPGAEPWPARCSGLR
jgi:hypothetical protein